METHDSDAIIRIYPQFYEIVISPAEINGKSTDFRFIHSTNDFMKVARKTNNNYTKNVF